MTLTPERVKEIIDSHGKWLRDEPGGSRAYLSGANLSGANLSGANLSGADLSGANLSGANLNKKYLQVTCIGSRKGTTTYCFDDDVIWCGCFTGTLEEFECRVKDTHANNQQHLKEYLGFISYVNSLKEVKTE
jgi:Pentapeptide repeats (8 copies)